MPNDKVTCPRCRGWRGGVCFLCDGDCAVPPEVAAAYTMYDRRGTTMEIIYRLRKDLGTLPNSVTLKEFDNAAGKKVVRDSDE